MTRRGKYKSRCGLPPMAGETCCCDYCQGYSDALDIPHDPIATTKRELAFEKLKLLTLARKILLAEGACVGSVDLRTGVDVHLGNVCARLRRIVSPSIAR